jgi:hypothetical protein
MEKKVPNPLVPNDGSFSFCPTLQTMDEFQNFRTMLLSPLQTPLKSKKMSFGYKFGLLLTALFTILLPVIYVGGRTITGTTTVTRSTTGTG